jgi:uncharacterized membrane-anchored protein
MYKTNIKAKNTSILSLECKKMIRGTAKKDMKTKKLIDRLSSSDIAVIYHQDLDEVAAIHLAEKKVKAVINCDRSISGRFPNQGPQILMNAGIPLYDNLGVGFFQRVKENDQIEIYNNTLYLNKYPICKVQPLNKKDIKIKMKNASENISNVLHRFINNTLTYAEKEKDIILSPVNLPKINLIIENKHVLIVTRGKNYKDDLWTIRPYIKEIKPVMIGVDGGADALLEFGWVPDLIIGDMDSVSDYALKKSKHIIVHAYPNGYAPGMERITRLGLKAEKFPYPGTSEDAALIYAYENNADLIVAVGSHTNMIDFLEKGRQGMASTFLVRMKVGYKVIDAKGVSKLYKSQTTSLHILMMFAAALFPVAIIAKITPLVQRMFHLIVLHIKLLIGI